MESAGGIHFRRGKQRVSRHLLMEPFVYSSVLTRRNPDFDEGCRLCRHPKALNTQGFYLIYAFLQKLF